MDLPEDELREYYKGVAKSLIGDGVTGFSEEELTEKLLADHPHNPFRPLSREEILHDLELSMKDIKAGRYRPAEEAFKELRQKIQMKKREGETGK